MPCPSLAGEKSTFLEKSVQERTGRTSCSEKRGFSEGSMHSMASPNPSAQIPKGSQSGSYQPGYRAEDSSTGTTCPEEAFIDSDIDSSH